MTRRYQSRPSTMYETVRLTQAAPSKPCVIHYLNVYRFEMPREHSKRAALTGGIASGKSTVSRMFQELGAYVIDADIVARQVVEPGRTAWQEIVEHFGTDILLDDRQIDRKKLGSIIFRQPGERQILNHLTHPRVIERIDCQVQEIHHHEPDRLILVDVPLLIEASMHSSFAIVIVVYVYKEVQLTRLMQRDNISAQEAQTRIRAQMPLAEKVTYATHIIRNESTLVQTRNQVAAIYREIS